MLIPCLGNHIYLLQKKAHRDAQRKDKDLKPIIDYLEEKRLPNNEIDSQRIMALVSVMILETEFCITLTVGRETQNGQLCLNSRLWQITTQVLWLVIFLE